MRTDLGSACSNRIVIFTPSPAPITTACKTHASKDARTISGPRDSLQLQNAITAQAHPMPTIQLSCDSTSQTAPSSGCSDSLQGHQSRPQCVRCAVHSSDSAIQWFRAVQASVAGVQQIPGRQNFAVLLVSPAESGEHAPGRTFKS